ncbi:hypothetical protein [Kocuria massiliensis]|uniref:hypothetical protein n=1 Tax=Kocuria massiliensis TaxID=1926282 RepID=UPI0022B9C35E|nr:hypothetical protein [Kocuria massiliensis]
MYDPENHLHSLGIAITKTAFPCPAPAVYVPRLDTVFIQPGLHPHLERSALAHEARHVEDGTKHTNGNVERHRIIERRCNFRAAKLLIPIRSLVAQLVSTNDLGEVAYNLRVTGGILRSRLEHLTVEEEHIMKEATCHANAYQ